MVDTARLVARVETKGVKRATDELDKLSKEAGKAEGSAKKLGAAFKLGAQTLAKASAAIGAASVSVGALAAKSAAAQKEWQNFANIARTSVDDFKATAFATEQVGISAEKLADISKDTNEKLGEFIATGGGGFKDFFDEVAPKVGLTAEELQGLSGPQVLGRVQQAFEQANVPIEQQSFFLESIASDTTALIPLLANEGRELSRLTSRYNELNDALKLSASEQGGLNSVAESFNLLGQTSSNALDFIVGSFAPEFNAAIDSVAKQVSKAADSFVFFFKSFQDGTEAQLLNEFLELQEKIKEEQEQTFSSDSLQNASNNRIKFARQRQAAIEGELEALREKNREEAKAASSKFTPTATGTAFQSVTSSTAEEDAIRESLDRRRQLRNDFNNAEFEAEQEYQIKREDAIEASLQREKDLRQQFDAEILKSEQDFQIRQEAEKAKGLSNLASLQSSSNKKLFRIGQAAAIAQATINTSTAISNALAVQPFPLGLALATTAAAAGGAQLAAIASQSPPSARQQGGQFSRGQDLLVGEKGPELVRFNSGGRIATADQTAALGAASAGPQVVVNNYASGTKAVAETMSDGRVRVIVNEVLNAEVSQPNSQFNKNLDRTRKVQRRF